MKELTRSFEDTKIEIHEEKQQEKKLTIIGSALKIPGLTLFEYNIKTGELSKAKYKEIAIQFDNSPLSQVTPNKKPSMRSKVIHDDNCIYLQALNFKNAKKKILKLGFKVTILIKIIGGKLK